MVFTTPLGVIKFTHSTYVDVRSESLGTGDGVETNFYVKNKPIWGGGTVSVYVGTSLQNSSAYSVDLELGKVQFNSAVANGSGVTSHYTYASVSSDVMNNFVTYAEAYIAAILNDTSNSSLMELYANLMAGHLLMKNLSAQRAKSGINSYSIGYMQVDKGDKEAKMANMYWDNFTTLIKGQVRTDTVRATFTHSISDENTYSYFNRVLEEDE